VKIGPIDVEIIGLTKIVKKETETAAKHEPSAPSAALLAARVG